MCGFVCAFTKREGFTPEPSVLNRMDAAMRHRGPDQEGARTIGPFSARHRRLSIIDLEGGRQPMDSADGKVCVVFNGEIYNYKELAAELRAAGHAVRCASDTAVLLAAYLAWGDSFLERLNGMFAFVLYDERETPRILAARDRFGEKPLYILENDDAVYFCSELKALHAGGLMPKQLDPIGLYSYFTLGYVVGPRTIVTGVSRLAPRHAMTLDAAGTRREWAFWSIPRQQNELTSVKEATNAVLDSLRESVRLRMIADVRVGFFLSGGVDSSSLVALASEITRERLQTFSIGFREESFDERAYARVVAQRFGTNHHELVMEPSSLELAEEVAWSADEPISDDSLIPAWHLSRMTRDHVKVALSGDGGDELFAGYALYRGHLVSEAVRRVPAWIRFSIARGLERWPSARPELRFRLLRRARNLRDCSLEGHQRFVAKQQAIFRRDQLGPLCEGLSALCTEDTDRLLFEPLFSERRSVLAGIAQWQQAINLVDLLLFKIDRMSMAHSLEVRAPFLDHRVAEVAARIPFRLKLSMGRTKYILRKAMDRYFQGDFLWRRKMGFNVPLHLWFRGDLGGFLQAQLLRSHSVVRALFGHDHLSELIGSHEAMRRNWGRTLWALLMFEMWCRRYGVDDSAVPGPQGNLPRANDLQHLRSRSR
jgi:asparagine synthase (glutamine-hydrolysing)